MSFPALRLGIGTPGGDDPWPHVARGSW